LLQIESLVNGGRNSDGPKVNAIALIKSYYMLEYLLKQITTRIFIL